MQRRKLLTGTGIILAVLSVGFVWLRAGPSQDLYLHDVYLVVAPLHVLILSLLLSGIAALVYLAGSHFTPHGFNRLLAVTGLVLTGSSSVVCTAAGFLRWDFQWHSWLVYGLVLAGLFAVLGFAFVSTSLLWTLLWNFLRVARRRIS
jgi:hypothetical protein